MTYPFYTRDARDITVDASASVQDPDHPSGYLPDQGLVDAVNVALLLKRPLLLTGEPGTGKTQLAYSVAWQLASRKLLNLTSCAWRSSRLNPRVLPKICSTRLTRSGGFRRRIAAAALTTSTI